MIKERKMKWKGHSETYKGSCGKNREKWIERIIIQKDDMQVVEGITYEHKTLYYGEKEWQDSQEHLIGYHYFVLQHKVNGNWQDIEGFQGNIKEDGYYNYFIYNVKPLELVASKLTYDEALKLFNRRNGFDIPNKLDEVKELAKKMGVMVNGSS